MDHQQRAYDRVLKTCGHLQPSNCSAQDYTFTVNSNNVLSKEQRDFYEKNGFIVIRNLFPATDIEKYRKRFIQIASGEVPKGPTMTMMRDVKIAKTKLMGETNVTKLQDWQDDEVLFEYCSHAAILPYVQSIIGENIRSMHTMLINKPADLGEGTSRHPPHQDLWYFPFRPSNLIVASWTAMQKINKQNGCLCVIPGSHNRELLLHGYPDDGTVNKMYHGIQGMTEGDMSKMLHLEMEVGDTVFFHPLLIHGSGRNLSSGFRKAISCHYASTDCSYINVKGTIQESIMEEVESVVKRRGVEGVSFNDIWHFKSRLISGREGKLDPAVTGM
eukprot:GFYU01001401.1.p1 GENE.GFYU01001401.1~~GFYU01001401.1.p1  ORF type:complete len:330 (-),score=100.78 GFYU01001401.1:210-1199(-)